MNCSDFFYQTTYKRFFGKEKTGNFYATLASPIPEKDPTLIPGHFANNLIVEGEPRDTKTWPRPAIDVKPEEYVEFLKKLKLNKNALYDQYFSNPEVDLKPILETIKDSKLSTYGSCYSPEYYVSRKEDLKWRRLKLDTSMFKYQETISKTYYSRIDEVPEMRTLAKPFSYPHDEEQLKRELRKINKTNQSAYYLHYCDIQGPRMKALLKAGKLWKDPIDRYTNRQVGVLVPQKDHILD